MPPGLGDKTPTGQAAWSPDPTEVVGPAVKGMDVELAALAPRICPPHLVGVLSLRVHVLRRHLDLSVKEADTRIRSLWTLPRWSWGPGIGGWVGPDALQALTDRGGRWGVGSSGLGPLYIIAWGPCL